MAVEDSVEGIGSASHAAETSKRERNGIEASPASAGAMPIAISGMACRLPGDIFSPQDLWEFLIAGRDARSPIPASRFNISGFYSSPSESMQQDGMNPAQVPPKPSTINTRHGYFLSDRVDLGAVDASFFSMTRGELERCDPHQKQMLEVARECIEDAGEVGGVAGVRGKEVGCYMGSFGDDWVEMFGRDTLPYGLYRVSGYGDFALSNRISYEMDLKGPNMTIRTACSASMVALDKACQDVANGRCTSAIVGGANLLLAPTMTVAMSEQGVLAPDGSCKTFSADADGYGRGEGICAIYIKPLRDALKDGNPIRAVIRATATNHNGRTAGIAKPSSAGQEAMIRKAYALAGIPQHEIGSTAFVECHGTGTRTGDPIETRALARLFGPSGGVYIGSVKPNLGHSEGASGLTSVIKAVLALERRVIPPNIKFKRPNPNIPFREARLVVPLAPTPWPAGRAERVSVSSFGIGGSNAHVIIDSARGLRVAAQDRRTGSLVDKSAEPQLILCSAHSSSGLTRVSENVATYLQVHPDNVADVAYTLANRRAHLPYRGFSVIEQGDHGRSSTTANPIRTPNKLPLVVMIFTGQGAQWPEMGKNLLLSKAYPSFLDSIRRLDTELQSLAVPPRWSIEKHLLIPGKAARMDSADMAQPLCTAVQIAVVDTYNALGITPAAVVGHSSGEIAAGYAAGALTAREAMILAYERGNVTRSNHTPGGMAAVSLSSAEAERFLEPGVFIACHNAPLSVTLSGDLERLVDVVARIHREMPDAMVKILRVDTAYHSHHMADIADQYRALVEGETTGAEPWKALFFLSVTGKLLESGMALDPGYWQANLTSPVLFHQAVSSLLQHQDKKHNLLLLEVGPHSSLSAPLRQIQAAQNTSHPYVPSLIRFANSTTSLLTSLGKMYQHGLTIDFSKLLPHSALRTLPDLPRYPWDHSTSYWYESRLSREWRQRVHPHHDLLGVRQPESTESHPTWRNLLHLDGNAAWIRDHKIKGDVVFPFAAYAAMAGEAARQLASSQQIEDTEGEVPKERAGYDLRNVVMSTVLVLHEGEGCRHVEMITSFKKGRLTDDADSEWWEFSIESHNDSSWTRHCVGETRAVLPGKRTAADMRPRAGDPSTDTVLPRVVNRRHCYQRLRQCGWNYGPRFEVLDDVSTGTTERVASAKSIWSSSHETILDDRQFYAVHPTVVDGAVQMIGTASTLGWTRWLGLALPTSVDLMEVRACGPDEKDLDVMVNATEAWSGKLRGTSVCRTNSGETVLRLTGVTMTIVEDEKVPDGLTIQGVPLTARCSWVPHETLNADVVAGTGSEGQMAQGPGRPSKTKHDHGGDGAATLHGSSLRANVTVLRGSKEMDFVSHPLIALLEGRGFRCTPCLLDQPLPPNQDIIACLDGPSASFFDPERLSKKRVEAFKNLLGHAQEHGSGILWVTGLCQYQCSDPKYAQVIGAARTVRNEMVIDFATCEVHDLRVNEQRTIAKVADVFEHFHTRRLAETSDATSGIVRPPTTLEPEMEYVVYEGTVYVGRYEPFDLNEEAHTALEGEKITLQIDTPGRLDTLAWVRAPAAQELGVDEVEVEVYAVGLNFKDVLGAVGVTPLPRHGLGIEATGRVRDIGAEVRDLRPGDRILALSSGQGTLASEFITSHQLCVKLPESLSFEDAATMPCVFATVLHSLMDIGRLEECHSVLIHSACGGVGLAAIQIAKALGAEIYATVGSEDKAVFLTTTYDIPVRRIFNSRDTGFADDLIRRTGGRGVDVVLNSLAGEFLHASWRCVAPFGRMVEIGKSDLLGKGKLELDVFEANRSYCAVDLEGLCREKKGIVKRLLTQTLKLYAAGKIKPIHPLKVFTACDVQDGFRYLQRGQNIGKAVVALRDPGSGNIRLDPGSIANRKAHLQLEPSSAYLLVGGLGGLGRAIAMWMVEHAGARHIVFLSRSAGSDTGHAEFVRELESLGCSVDLIPGDVCNKADVAHAIAITKGRLKGILQLSIVLRDKPLTQMSLRDWAECANPKVTGTWNLHNASVAETAASGTELDFFVLLSSISGTIGQPGQANYAGANTFLDAFAQYRHTLGLVASSVALAPVEDVGWLSGERQQNVLRKMRTHVVRELEVLRAVEAAMIMGLPKTQAGNSRAYVSRGNFVVGLASVSPLPLSSPENRTIWRKDPRMERYHALTANVDGTVSGGVVNKRRTPDADTQHFIATLRSDTALLLAPETAPRLAHAIGRKLFALLLRPVANEPASIGDDVASSAIPLDRSLSDLGMDSLVATEMRVWWRHIFGFDIGVLELLGTASLEALGKRAVEGLKAQAGPRTGD